LEFSGLFWKISVVGVDRYRLPAFRFLFHKRSRIFRIGFHRMS